MRRPSTTRMSWHCSLYNLGPYLDSNGVLRLQERTKMGSGKDRVVLPSSSPITELIIAELHEKLLHANHETLINELRQSFWIPKMRPTVRRYVVLFTFLSTRAIHLEIGVVSPFNCGATTANFQGAITEHRRALDVLNKDQLEREFTGPR
ncbi:uncharacterized protein LOC108027391 [Drosophila biarmipes]|uniref:uncharacterized protein LOC108027391 n=1 Tax=Drosophila biarmipes TaxID=125945 RepID=UPI0007E7E40C|nr:uncharacterized protein LOC108027391 [Drosophila biarmipes]XP_043947118.1 uncharacterized protein LOC108027391 [Drosophila biarmipes]XP_050746292.1 uncharacterized protein LOC108027391 [Drosophila biarmipes]